MGTNHSIAMVVMAVRQEGAFAMVKNNSPSEVSSRTSFVLCKKSGAEKGGES
jgi:hypothetical protein